MAMRAGLDRRSRKGAKEMKYDVTGTSVGRRAVNPNRLAADVTQKRRGVVIR